LHEYTCLRITYLQVYLDRSIGWGKLECIGEVVGECLPDAIRVCKHRYQIIYWQFLLKEPLSRKFLLVCDGFSHNFDQIAPYQRKFELVCLDARCVQQISYQSHLSANLSLSPRQQILKFGEQIHCIV